MFLTCDQFIGFVEVDRALDLISLGKRFYKFSFSSTGRTRLAIGWDEHRSEVRKKLTERADQTKDDRASDDRSKMMRPKIKPMETSGGGTRTFSFLPQLPSMMMKQRKRHQPSFSSFFTMVFGPSVVKQTRILTNVGPIPTYKAFVTSDSPLVRIIIDY